MKSLKVILSFLVLFAINKVSAQQVSKVELQATGLTCSMCSQATEKSIRSLSYVGDVQPDLNKNVFVITFKKDAEVNFDDLSKKVIDAGFSVGKLDATIDFDNAKVDSKGQTVVNGKVYRFVNAKDKTLSGPTKVTVIDKNFVSNGTFKQKSKELKLDTYATGTSVINGKKTRVYHLSI
ncbi:heavy-metal-associated domain-containing protein [Pedobacter montanisoli]|uniref:Cation transporter n=1 Tax=Pedobacter montanisoli TaxID=2923277 RepID=A0ABS9ZUV9_9SPHI|nr:cation transporter [Pedobacter montanisoli]MCJ0741774.1 cation transporter [Pedobacter montanisoli]